MSVNLEQDPAYGALLKTLLEKTKTGKLRWEPTADEGTFLAAVKGERTFEVVLKSGKQVTAASRFDPPGPAFVRVRDREGKLLFDTPWSPTADQLYVLAWRIAMRVDENMDSTMQLLENL